VLSLNDRIAISAALNDPDLDPDLKTLIGLRVRQHYVDHRPPLSQDVRYFVVQGGDTPEVINEALGFALTGDHAEEPGFTWIEHHGQWFELAYEGGKGAPTRIFVENGAGTELELHYLCHSHFWPDGEGDGQ
jgi:hypothetical protein